jgi:type I restriction enzyme S subunit
MKPDAAKVNSHYLNYYFLSPSLVREFEERSIGSAQVRINLTELRLFTVNVPPLDEQQEIVRRIQALFAFADRIESRLAEAQTTIDRLTPSTLAKAFRGELVPQDPADEPAAALLERIRTERMAEAAKPRRNFLKSPPKMKKLTAEGLKQTIQELPRKEFDFDELKRAVSADYDQLSAMIITLLDEKSPMLKQEFDIRSARTLIFSPPNSRHRWCQRKRGGVSPGSVRGSVREVQFLVPVHDPWPRGVRICADGTECAVVEPL